MLALSFLLMIFATAPSVPPTAAGELADVSAADTNAIYSNAIRAIFPHWQFDEKKITLIVVENQTRVDSYDGPTIADADIRTELPDLTADVLADFHAKNAARSQLQLSLTVPSAWRTFASSEVHGQFPAGDWFAFYQRYPGCPGLLSLSSIGFNRTGDRALVYVAHAYSVDGGKGHVLLFKKHGTKWNVIKRGIVWVWVG